MANKIDLQAIVSEYYAGLYRFGLSLAKNESEAADLTQEAFLILAKHEKQIREPERIKTWLFTTLRREFFRKIRTRKAHPEVEFQPEEHEISGIESDALRSIDGKTAVEALAQIEESYRSTVELFYLGDLSYKEISATLGVPVGTVMSRLSRGKEQLRRAMATILEGDTGNILAVPNAGSPKTPDEQKTNKRVSERLPSLERFP